MAELPTTARGPRRTQINLRDPVRRDRGSIMPAARNAARSAFNPDRLRSSPIPHVALPHASVADNQDSDDEDLAGLPGDIGLQGGVMSDDEAEVDMDAEFDEADDDDELLGDVMDDDLGEEHENDYEHEHEHDEQVEVDEQPQMPVFDAAAIGLREINNLAHFGVSSHKPGNGVEELLSDDLDKYWQSDGQQPHLLTIHFLRRVEIRAIRFYVDYNQDESYTPTHIFFYAGTGHHDLIQFAQMPLTNPMGWQDVPIADCGGGPDGHSLCCWVVQMHVKENHQNGKDTHIRGIKIFALDESTAGGASADAAHDIEINIDNAGDRVRVTEPQNLQSLLDSIDFGHSRFGGDESGSIFSDFLRDPVIR